MDVSFTDVKSSSLTGNVPAGHAKAFVYAHLCDIVKTHATDIIHLLKT